MHRSIYSVAVQATNKLVRILLAAGLIGLATNTVRSQSGPAPRNSAGEAYTDRDGVRHTWQIDPSHVLMWDGAPFFPIGGTFTPRSLGTTGEDAWRQDVHAMEILKSKGIFDLVLWPEKPLPAISAAAFQRLIDYLDTNGFRYGLEFGPGVTNPLSGIVIKPSHYRYFETDSVTAHWAVTNSDRALAVMVDHGDGEDKILQGSTGVYAIKDNFLSLPIDTSAGSGKVIGLLYPHKSLTATGNTALPDLWTGYDDYRDRLLAFLSGIKFGKGLRFFLDPLVRRLGMADETEYLIPESNGFGVEWEAYLARKYPEIADACKAWGLAEGDFKTHAELTHLVPLWANERGIPFFFNLSTGAYTRVDSSRSFWWSDFLQCRNESVAYYMKALAEVLKRQIADVPVVYTWTQIHPLFVNNEPSGGFDGLAIANRGAPSVAKMLAPAYSAAQQSARPLWVLATESGGDTSAMPAADAHAPGFHTKAALSSTFDTLRQVGVKGLYADSLQAENSSDVNVSSLIDTPEKLDWLHDYQATLDAQPALIRRAPHVLFYPMNAPGPAHAGRIPGAADTYWLPSFASGETLNWWPSYSGYTLPATDAGPGRTVLVSLQGRRETHLETPDPKRIQAFMADGSPAPLKISGKTEVVVWLDATPTVFTTGGQSLVPKEAVDDVIAQLEGVITNAAAQHLPGAKDAESSLGAANDRYRAKDFDNAYTFSLGGLGQILSYAAPYIWIEGEIVPKAKSYNVHTFDENAYHGEASGGWYLHLDNPNPPLKYGYGAHYQFDVARQGRYNVWLAGSAPGPSTSPFRWGVDTPANRDPVDPKPHGPLYANDRFGWMLLGTVDMQPGSHAIEISVTDRAVSPPNYKFDIDSILITPRTFDPNGSVRPVPIDPHDLTKENLKAERQRKSDRAKF